MTDFPQTLNHYRIVSPLGEGGMGQVYRAEDTRLKRQVAIKVLPAELATDPERLARLEREAQLLAQLEHPNVAAVYGLEEAKPEEGRTVRFVVMQLAEGETLADRLVAGALPVEEAQQIARQIAEGLEAAHERGIVHRDLKPANVMLGPDGTVKVLDFGLAKALGPEHSQGSTELTASPTVLGATAAGVIMGTAGYMSPEQARGKPVDKRSDIWAFGCVLWEMLTGQRLFDGETVTDVIAAVVTREIDWTELPANTPPYVRRLLLRSLERDPRSRLRDIGEARIGLTGESLDEGAVPATTPAAARPRWGWLVAGIAVGVLMGAFARQLGSAPPPSPAGADPTARVMVHAPDWSSFGFSSGLYLTPDGKSIGYHDRETGALRLRDLDSWDSRVVPGTEQSRDGFFSPDGRWFAYRNQGRDTLEKILVDGGTPVVLVRNIGIWNSGAWGESGNLYFSGSVGDEDGIWRVGQDGADLTMVFGREGTNMGWFVDLLPDERGLLLTAASPDRESVVERIDVLDLVDGTTSTVLAGARQSRYLDAGFLAVITGENTLSVVPFDVETLSVSGAVRRAVEGVRTDGNFNARYTVSADGTLAYVPAPEQRGTASLLWIEPDGDLVPGVELPVAIAPSWYFDQRISPDGRTLALSASSGDRRGVWLVDTTRGAATPFGTERDGSGAGPPTSAGVDLVWSRDGSRWAFARSGDQGFYDFTLWVGPADESAPPLQMPDFPAADANGLLGVRGRIELGNWSPDSSRFIVARFLPAGGSDVWIVAADGSTPPEPFLTTPAEEVEPRFSPDGSLVTYVSDRSGRPEVYVRSYPGAGREIAVSTTGGSSPVWRPDGRALYFLRGSEVVVAPIEDGIVGDERVVVTLPQGAGGTIDIDPSTGRLVTVQRPQVEESTEIRVVFGWAEELKRQTEAER